MRKGYIYTVVVLTILSSLFLFNSSVMASGRNCSHPSCNNKPVKGGVYCSVHTCKVDGCTSARVTEKGSYCYKHKCKMKNCEAGNDGSNYCSAHKKAGEAAEKKMWEKYQKSSSSGSSKKSYAGIQVPQKRKRMTHTMFMITSRHRILQMISMRNFMTTRMITKMKTRLTMRQRTIGGIITNRNTQ